MNPETVRLLEELAAKLGTTSAYLWSALLRQAYIAGWQALIGDILAVAAIMILSRRMIKTAADPTFDPEEQMGRAIFTFGVGGIAVMICVGHLGFEGLGFVTAWSNPEYWALREIGEILKK